ncbi:uncharacterized protein LOC110456107 [Mizuhopecten yessoensis]|uniref:LIM domain-containing protein D n=1 Tax=Mizuhopecten yessoensis TaxID=6573 RepID=A0A210R475_MIZYE|nr:uncharacterized protein LOC110456107 [Mizuhopecten yessoensis]OWF55704.1 LIM domain-containing protein D [Mizuhopecten yessoensis]
MSGEEEDVLGPLSMVWKARCPNEVPIKTLKTWQPIEEDFDDVFHMQTSLTTEPRYLDYKSDEGFDHSNNDDSFLSYNTGLTDEKDDESSSKSEENGVESNDSNYSSEMDLSYDSAIPNNHDSVSDVHKLSLNEEDIIKSVKHEGNYTERPLASITVTRRQIVPVRPHIRTQSCPISAEIEQQQNLSFDSSMTSHGMTSYDETTVEAIKLRDVTRAARSFSRPLVRGTAEEHEPDEDVECKTYKFISVNVPKLPPPPNPEDDEETIKPKNEFQVLTDITALTRKATRPKVKDLDFKPKSNLKRSKSVMQISSPTVPALSPIGDRSPMSRSRSSSTTSPPDYMSYAFTYQTDEDACFKCGKTVYQLDKVGPIRKVLFHKQCFRCCTCGSALTVKNYFQNFNDKSDKQVYCRNHKPSEGKGSVSLDDRSISVILNHPKLDTHNNTIIRGPEEDRHKPNHHGFRGAATTPKLDVVCKQWDEVNKSFMERLEETSPRGRNDVLKLNPSEARSVWSRSAMGAASLDFGTPNPRRNIHHFYQKSKSSSTWTYM